MWLGRQWRPEPLALGGETTATEMRMRGDTGCRQLRQWRLPRQLKSHSQTTLLQGTLTGKLDGSQLAEPSIASPEREARSQIDSTKVGGVEAANLHQPKPTYGQDGKVDNRLPCLHPKSLLPRLLRAEMVEMLAPSGSSGMRESHI